MSVMHCPLCVGLAVLSVLRALAHFSLMVLWLEPAQAASGAQPWRRSWQRLPLLGCGRCARAGAFDGPVPIPSLHSGC